MELMQLGCGLSIILILGVLAFCLFKNPLIRNMNDYFDLASGLKSGPFQKNEKGVSKIEWIVIILGVTALMIMMAPAQTLTWMSHALSDPASPREPSTEVLNNLTRCIMGFLASMCFLSVWLKPR
jgi:hypothetical protein